MMIISLALAIAAGWYTIQLVYSIIIVFPPTGKTAGNLIIFIAGLTCVALEVVSWFRRRNTIALKLSPEGIWTEKTGWLDWRVADLKVDRWRDVLSIACSNSTSAHLIQWRLSELNIRSSELLAIKNLIRESQTQ